MSKPLFLSIDRLPDPVRAALLAYVELLETNPETLKQAVSKRSTEVRAIGTRGKTRIDSDLLDRLPSLGLIAGYGVGYDKVDAHAAAERGIVVTHTPEVLNADVADLAVALLLATVRRIPQADKFVREGQWLADVFPLTSTLRGRTVGLVGMGRIGQAIAARLVAFDLDIAYHTRRQVEETPYLYFDNLLELARHVDVLITIVPGGKATNNLIDASVLEALGPKGVFINVARGTVVDQEALIAALDGGVIEAAGLDVYQNEPAVSQKLISRDNVVLLPHIGSGTHFTRAAMNQLYLDNVLAWLHRRPIPTPVPECRV